MIKQVFEYRTAAKEAQDELELFLDAKRDEGLTEEEVESFREEWLESHQYEAEALADADVLEDFDENEPVVPEDEWESYVYDLIQELVPAYLRMADWPWNCLNYDQAANDLAADYTSVELSDGSYYVRS